MERETGGGRKTERGGRDGARDIGREEDRERREGGSERKRGGREIEKGKAILTLAVIDCSGLWDIHTSPSRRPLRPGTGEDKQRGDEHVTC